jgi:uncharacterized protein (DUF111 family)
VPATEAQGRIHTSTCTVAVLPEAEEVDVEIGGGTRKMPVKCGWMHGRMYLLKAEFGPAQVWACELDLPVRDVIRAVEAAGRNLQKEPPQGSGDP